MTGPSKKRFLSWAAALALGAAPALVALAAACLPDISTAGLAAFDGGDPPTPGFCGDGIIDVDAGERCDPSEAGAPGCTAQCEIACDGGLLDPSSGHCYFSAPAAPRFESAKQSCEAAGAHIVTFVSDAEFGLVAGWKASDFWVGLLATPGSAGVATYAAQVPPEEPGWSWKCDGCYARVPAGSRDFPKRDPLSSRQCVFAGDGGPSWLTDNCAGLNPAVPVVCEREPAGTTAHKCGGFGCLTVAATSHHYVYVGTASSPAEAAAGCKGMGASLAVFETREERETVGRELDTFGGATTPLQLWVGLARGDGGVWHWADGAPQTQYPLEWSEGQPAGGSFAWMRLALGDYGTQLLHSDDGASRLPYLCELAK